jgi:NADH:ubiquinone oxidoreductase subunit 6 (subunit J)
MSKKPEKKLPSFVDKNELPLSKENYLLMLVGFVIIIIGFVVMSGNNDRSDIYSFRRITLAPIIVLIGFIFEIYAIMKKSKDNTPEV